MPLRFVLLRIPIYLLFVYAVLCALLYFSQDRLVFPRQSGVFSECAPMKALGAEPREIDGLRFYEKSSRQNQTTLVVFHGNGGTACGRDWILEGLQDLALNFVFLEYPGYAQADPNSPAPSEKIILEQAEAMVKRLIESGQRVMLFGESLGTGVATFAASRINVAAVILQAPYTSISDVGQFYYPIFPVHFLSRSPFDAAAWAQSVQSPVLILRATHDEIIPFKITEAQIKNFKSEVTVVEFQSALHDTMPISEPERYWKSVRSFIEKKL